jgi:site-specific DNA-methyltransferase (adenine-specific)
MINTIHNENCLDTLKRMDDKSINCIITSPPYNKGFYSKNRTSNKHDHSNTKCRKITYGDFDDDLEESVYIANQCEIIKECLRVLKDDGSLFYNHIDILRELTTIHPTFVYNFPIKQIIIWDRANTPKLDNSYFYPITEYIFWIKKTKESKPKFNRTSAVFQKNIWKINPETNNDHPAPFPLKIPTNIILACTDVGDVIYDPYMGSGTTAIAAIKTNRNYIGSELYLPFIEKANKRIQMFKQQITLF